ncbi:DUF605-domain-containing protein [Thelephora ganbajun]|uniref:DUF605-domain-containing protein n=1 Tax=Thelephora ganbajun TaxID=370292 RepID=A0ACB6ZX98_THEGA|nr:DUF605-domain-containing protein [Thelephora ganbajun]
MSTQPLKNLGLPPVPPELKFILGFLQRADELKSQEPIVAYWALYHAAQVGIAARVKDPAAKGYLLPLLTLLEKMKKEIGHDDAIDNDVAAAAYVENFALRVFEMTDSEDRAGKATRGTAKKFLVAANLLELLQVFDKVNVSDSVDDKIRYAKWKATDIAKAFREGRRPAPGPANQAEQDSPVPNITIEAASPEQSISADPVRGWPGSPSRFDSDPSSPGNWSTVATPGTAIYHTFDLPISPPPSSHDPRRVTVSGELEGLPEQPPTSEEPLFGDPHTRRPTQSQPGPSPPQSPLQPPGLGSILTSGVIPTHIETSIPPPIGSAVDTTPQPPIQPHQQISPLTRPPIPIQHPPPQVIRNVVPPPPPAAGPIPPPQLTPKQIAQAQKHCRYAISALDYEDFERARQDLLDALKIIEG